MLVENFSVAVNPRTKKIPFILKDSELIGTV
jgi:hypothetical protein